MERKQVNETKESVIKMYKSA